MNKINQLEVLLFLKGEPQSKKYILETLKVDSETLTTCLNELRKKYSTPETGIVILETENELAFGTNPNMSSFVEEIEKEERGGELSKASLETIAVIIYKKSATRSEIDYIRGVNSSFTLRNLYLRGLITKEESTKNTRSPKYTPTIELLRFLGIQDVSELDGYQKIFNELQEKVKEEETKDE